MNKGHITISTTLGVLAILAGITTPISVFYLVTGGLSDRQTKSETEISNLTQTVASQGDDIKAAANDAKTAADGVSILVKLLTGKELVKNEVISKQP